MEFRAKGEGAMLLRNMCAGLVILISLGCAVNRNAAGSLPAEGRHFSKGMWEASVGGTAGTHLADNDLVERAFNVSLGPLYGYFITERLEILGALGVEYEEVKYEESSKPLAIDYTRQSDYSLAAGLQYSFDSESQIIPFIRVFAGMMNSKRVARQVNIPLVGAAKDERKTTDPYCGLRVGIRYFVARNISGDIGLGWQNVQYDKDFGGSTNDYSLIIGAAFFF